MRILEVCRNWVSLNPAPVVGIAKATSRSILSLPYLEAGVDQLDPDGESSSRDTGLGTRFHS